MNNITKTNPVPDFEAIKAKQNATWSSGDYGKIGITLQKVGEDLAEQMDLTPSTKVLDVAAGNGNATLAFARRWCEVISTDYVEKLLNDGRERAKAEGLNIHFQIADAEKLPFNKGEFGAVVSTFGVMFTPNQKQSAHEMVRVCCAGGKIGMANWTPSGFIGQLFKVIGKHVTPPAGVKSPALWGQKEWVEETFSACASAIDINLKDFIFRYPSPQYFVDFFRTYYGPAHKAFLALDKGGQDVLEKDLLATISNINTAKDGSMRVPSQYAEVIITKS